MVEMMHIHQLATDGIEVQTQIISELRISGTSGLFLTHEISAVFGTAVRWERNLNRPYYL